jgi:hypothetical protein
VRPAVGALLLRARTPRFGRALRPRSKLAARLTVSSVATRSNFRDGSVQRRAIQRNRISAAHGDAVKIGGTDFSCCEGTSIAHQIHGLHGTWCPLEVLLLSSISAPATGNRQLKEAR